MNIQMKLFVSCLLLTCCSGTTNPGFQSRVTRNGVNFAAKVAVDVLSTKITGQHIPDVPGKAHHLEYTLSNIKITSFSKPQSGVSFQAAKGLTWTASNLAMSVHADFRYKYKKIIKISDHGSIDVVVKGTSFSLAMAMGEDNNGRPTITSTGCTCDISGISIKFHGGASWLYNLLTGLFKSDLKKQLSKVICSSAESSVNSDANKSLSKLPVTVAIDHQFLLDYRLVQQPTFTSSYLDLSHKGEVFWEASGKEAPFAPPTLPTFSNDSKMVYFMASEYLANTFTYEAHEHGILQKNVTAKDLPDDKRSYLNTTCAGFTICIGSLIPEAKKRFPNSQVEVRLVSGQPPKVSITQNDIRVKFEGNMGFWARADNGSEYFMFSVNAQLNTTLVISIKDELIHGTVDQMELGISLNKTNIGTIQTDILQKIINSAIDLYVKPQLNTLGSKGFPLPVTGRVKLTNTVVSLMDKALLIGTDITYLPKEEMGEPKNEFMVVSGNNLKKVYNKM